jgi:kinetochore protein Spc7/SPC105
MPPLREIPAHISTRKGSPKKATPQSLKKTDNLIDFDVGPTPAATITGADSLPNPFQVGGNSAIKETRVTLRTEEEQEAAAREREEQERKQLEKEVISRRDARRKKLANRRVSFAPEATLHTWDVVVEYQDSTTSSNATNSTRRASSVSSEPQTPGHLNLDPSEPPSTPPEQVEEETVTASPAHQRDLHQKKRRRSSGIPPMNFNNPDDDEVFSSSPFSGSSAGDVEETVEDDEDVRSNSNSDSEDDDETAMSMDGGETTDMSMASVKSSSTSGSSTRLDEALREAARQAGTQGIDFDEHGEQEATEEVVASFAPFNKPAALVNLESQEDQENINPFSAAVKANGSAPQDEQSEVEDITMDITMDMTRPMGGIMPAQEANDDELSMDVTRVFGGIISNEAANTLPRLKSAGSGRRQSSRRKSTSEESSAGDETMDLTMAIGGIRSTQSPGSDEDEDMTMELTTAVGGVLPQGRQTNRSRRQSMPTNQKRQTRSMRESVDSNFGDEAMEMTTAVGAILSSVKESTTGELDATTGMEITTALGGILQLQSSSENKAQAKKIMELEADLASSPFRADVIPNSPPTIAAPAHTAASETGSPSMAGFRGKGLRRSTEARKSTTPKSKISSSSTPVKKPATPSKQLTPQPVRPTTPSKTPPSKNVTVRSASPKRLFKEELQAASPTPQSAKSKKVATPNKLFQKDTATGTTTPSFILTPQRRRSSGVGLDREGLGSPRVAALLDRRVSIGEQAKSFTPSRPADYVSGVRFRDPQDIAQEIDREREQEEDRENGRSILEREVNQPAEERDVTLNLKEMIQSLTPKKKAVKPRKSLHVGAAKGILGKRPAELDDDEDEDESGMKRLKGHQGSPVKTVKLQAPPTKSETTTGRLTRAARKSLDETHSLVTPTTSTPNEANPTTPKSQGRFRNTDAKTVGPLVEKDPVEEPQVDEESFEDERIQLQDFLNMTNIQFMELTATKRRHTLAPKSDLDHRDSKHLTDVSLEDCIAAGAATIPMLELFQHACHELKSYISEGRKTVREIESETFEENPPLFREYISATPDIKLVMDNQLKNVKTHARLLSKEMWYDWRMTLLGTLKEGLFKTGEGMIEDEEILDGQYSLLNTILPKLIREAEVLEHEEAELQSAAEDLASCDPEALSSARQELISVDAEIETKKRMIRDLQRQLEEKECELASGVERKQICVDDIREAEKVREECRGWTSGEISSLKGSYPLVS